MEDGLFFSYLLSRQTTQGLVERAGKTGPPRNVRIPPINSGLIVRDRRATCGRAGVNECSRLLTTIDIGWFGSFPLFRVCGGSQRHFACRLRGAIVDCESGRSAVGIGDHPGASSQRRVEDGLTPLEVAFGACRHNRDPHQKQK
jgi:hypothetical protein